ncbi:serine protease inhibitor 2.1-like [Plodia interpunctella]|uniref:serine protease inhibitor 2.1-like n=1 Tax=Plodia interpunctella TaxID=58824 RepID=UPI002367A4E0|nr:serine protease inhibitor 2.1-like [Plodia interpunctella]
MERAVLLLFIASVHCAVDFSERPRNFSIELVYHTAQQTGGHVVISPFGIWTLMTGVALGATDNSYQQLANAFILPKNKASLINGYKKLTDVVLNPNTDGVQLTSKNFVFLDENFNVFPDFKRTVQNDFGAAVKVLNFKDPNSANVANSYIETSGGRVTNVLRSDDFRESRMILTNVISFKGLWSSPFNKSDTVVEPFYNEEKTVTGSVNMMYQKGQFPYSNVRELQSFVLEIPYGDDGKYSMIFVLPYPNMKVSEVYKNFANFGLKDVFKTLQRDVDEYGLEDIDVKIPRFHITTNVVMNKPLNDMGVYDIFQPDSASFDRVTKEDIFVSAIVHKADIEVTETGTVASAATSAYFADRISSPSFYANRPFVYFVIEKSTTTVLFGGIYSKPTVY